MRRAAGHRLQASATDAAAVALLCKRSPSLARDSLRGRARMPRRVSGAPLGGLPVAGRWMRRAAGHRLQASATEGCLPWLCFVSGAHRRDTTQSALTQTNATTAHRRPLGTPCSGLVDAEGGGAPAASAFVQLRRDRRQCHGAGDCPGCGKGPVPCGPSASRIPVLHDKRVSKSSVESFWGKAACPAPSTTSSNSAAFSLCIAITFSSTVPLATRR